MNTYDLIKEENSMPFNSDEHKDDVLWKGVLLGNENVIDSIEKREQLRSIRKCELPRSMNPDQEAFKKLGFEFEKIDGDNVMLKAKLPEGWSMNPVDSYHTSIYDEKGRERASFFYKGVFYDRNGHMVLYRRYGVRIESFENAKFEDAARVVVFDRNDSSFLKVSATFPNSWCDEIYQEQGNMHEWMKKKFPKCEDPLAYWN